MCDDLGCGSGISHFEAATVHENLCQLRASEIAAKVVWVSEENATANGRARPVAQVTESWRTSPADTLNKSSDCVRCNASEWLFDRKARLVSLFVFSGGAGIDGMKLQKSEGIRTERGRKVDAAATGYHVIGWGSGQVTASGVSAQCEDAYRATRRLLQWGRCTHVLFVSWGVMVILGHASID